MHSAEPKGVGYQFKKSHCTKMPWCIDLVEKRIKWRIRINFSQNCGSSALGKYYLMETSKLMEIFGVTNFFTDLVLHCCWKDVYPWNEMEVIQH